MAEFAEFEAPYGFYWKAFCPVQENSCGKCRKDEHGRMKHGKAGKGLSIGWSLDVEGVRQQLIAHCRGDAHNLSEEIAEDYAQVAIDAADNASDGIGHTVEKIPYGSEEDARYWAEPPAPAPAAEKGTKGEKGAKGGKGGKGGKGQEKGTKGATDQRIDNLAETVNTLAQTVQTAMGASPSNFMGAAAAAPGALMMAGPAPAHGVPRVQLPAADAGTLALTGMGKRAAQQAIFKSGTELVSAGRNMAKMARMCAALCEQESDAIEKAINVVIGQV